MCSVYQREFIYKTFATYMYVMEKKKFVKDFFLHDA
jgi:hypothetical protein